MPGELCSRQLSFLLHRLPRLGVMEKQVQKKAGLGGENGESSNMETGSEVEDSDQNGLGKTKPYNPAVQVRKKQRDVVSGPCRE